MTSQPPAPLSLALACPADSFWERWCRNASPEQKQHILSPAIRSGVVQLHHLPVPGLQASRNVVQTLIASITANRPPCLEPVVPACVRVVDATLDDDQRHAVAVALGSPDLSLIVGYPGSGKSRVVAELLRQAVAQAKRVLFVAAAGAALDRVIDRASDLDSHILRCSGAGETLPPRSVVLSLQERIRYVDEQTLPTARQRAEEARGHLARLAPLEDAWPRLRAIPTRLEALAARRAALERQRDSLASVVETEWASALVDALPPECADLRRIRHVAEQVIDARLRQVADRLQARKGETTRLGDERASLAESRGRGRWWSLSFWKSRGQPDPAPRLAELDRLLTTRREELTALEQERTTLEAALHRPAFEYAARSEALCRAEVLRREADIARELHEAMLAMATLEAEWSAALPAEVHPAAVEAAEQAWQTERTAASRELARRQAWLSALEQARPGLAFDFVLGARILAAPVYEVLALGTDHSPGAFDLLVIDDAHRISEKDLLAVARLAPRCVLVGEPGVPILQSPSPVRAGAARQADSSAGNVFLRLWVALHPDPVRLSTRWTQRGGRLIARLHPFAPEDEGQIAREPVFDRPEIELAIRTPPGAEPHIVEVGFPASTSVADAKTFLYRESEDLSIQAADSCIRWREAEEGVYLLLGSSGTTPDVAIGLDAGVVEYLGRGESACPDDPAWHTLALGFLRADGWDRTSAATWVGDRLGLRDLGRTACLSRVHRARPALASFSRELLIPRDAVQTPPACDGAEFVPCGESRDWTSVLKGRTDEPSPRTNGTTLLAPRLGRPRLGAGFEVDLGDGRRLDAIGPELRSGLPPRGIVNLPEACLVVQTLESLVADAPGFASAVDGEPHVAVLSLYSAQVELLRLLIRRSPALGESGLRILVGHPSALAHRECPLVCLSLTRSHSNRAVPFSDDPRDLLLALTRATERLLVFGDPGTMARRSQWFGALDHLTESTGPVEQTLLARLLAHLPERAAQARPAVALESSGV